MNLQKTSLKIALQFSYSMFQFSCIFHLTMKYSSFLVFLADFCFSYTKAYFFTAEYINWKTMFLLQMHGKIIEKYSYCKMILSLFVYCLIISSFVDWSSRSNNSLSKSYFVFLLSCFLSCIWLFWSGLNKLSLKNIWNNPHVTESRSSTLSSTIHIFTKSLSLSLLPKPWIKWKKLVAVSLKASSSFSKKFYKH